MSMAEMVVAGLALVAIAMSIVTLYLTYEWKIKVEKLYNMIEQDNFQTSKKVEDLDTALFNVKSDMYDLRVDYKKSGIETLKVRTEDHDKAIDAIRKDMLDLQVITGTLPSKAGTMRETVENALEELKTVQSAYKEQQAVLATTKEQMENLAEAYSGLHFTSEEFEQMRNELEDLSRRSA